MGGLGWFGVTVGATAASTRTLATFTVDRSGAKPVNTYTWTVPRGVRQVTFDAFGAAGNGTVAAPGGLGGEATGTFLVQPGEVFEIVVGGQERNFLSGGLNGGGDGDDIGPDNFGGGGGGGSDVRAGACAASMTCGLFDRVVVGGGGGGTGLPALGGAEAGGSGGGTNGGSGQGGTAAGGGGTQTSGGTAGCGDAFASSFGVGGKGADDGGGGGGGGWFGGGGGCNGAGGGGGSGHIDGLAISSLLQSGVRSGDGQVVISQS
jgi:hypothetical protein